MFRSAGKARPICTLTDPGLQNTEPSGSRFDFHVSVTGLTSARDTETDPDIHQNEIFEPTALSLRPSQPDNRFPEPASLKRRRANRTRDIPSNRLATRRPLFRPSRHHDLPAMASQLESFSKWLQLKIYQLEVTYSVYIYTPIEKFIFCALRLRLFFGSEPLN